MQLLSCENVIVHFSVFCSVVRDFLPSLLLRWCCLPFRSFYNVSGEHFSCEVFSKALLTHLVPASHFSMFFLGVFFCLLPILLNGILAAPAHPALVKRCNSKNVPRPSTSATNDSLPSTSSMTVTAPSSTPSNISISHIPESTQRPSSHPSSQLPSPTAINTPGIPFPPISIPPLHLGSLFAALFPKGITRNAFWSTAAGVIKEAKPLNLKSFNALSVSEIAAPRFAPAPDGSPSLEAKMAKGGAISLIMFVSSHLS